MNFRKILIKDDWAVAIRRKRSDCEIFSKDWKVSPFKVLKNPPLSWLADPFLIEFNGTHYLFVEEYSILKRKAHISCAAIGKNSNLKFKKCFETNHHLSFPNVYYCDGFFYMIPEAYQSNGTVLLQTTEKDFPFGWKLFKRLNEDQSLDSVRISDNLLLYSLFNKDGGHNNLTIFNLTNGNKHIIYNDNNKYSRNGGKIITHKDCVYRVCQNCEITYGGSLIFTKINKIGDSILDESIFFELKPEDISINCKPFALHTYNHDSLYEVIDVRYDDRRILRNIAAYLLFVFCKILKRNKSR